LGAIALAIAACTRDAGDSAARPDSPGADTFPAVPVDTNVVDITGPVILAAFPVTETEAGRSAAMGEALENFQRHLDRAADTLRAVGIEVHERYGASVHWRVGDTTTTRQVPPDRPLYILLSPAIPETFMIGVQTDSALIAQARRHFRPRPR
jgi:hypothetical protein